MAGNSLVISTPATAWGDRIPASRWIVSRNVDLVFIIGSVLAGYAYVALNVAAQVPITLLWWIWSVGFDGTHIFGTATRTYFDREAMRRHGRLFLGGLLFFFSLGPVMVALGWRLALALFVGTWSYYHVVKQHHGFAVLYKVKNGDLESYDNRLDGLFLAAALSAPPFLRFFVYRPQDLRLPEQFALARIAPAVPWLIGSACILLLLLWSWRQWSRWRAGGGLNLPKILLYTGVIPLHWMTFYWMSWQAAVPTVTIVHNLQYHALIWLHNRNRYGGENAPDRGRIPRAVSRSLLSYLAIGLLFSLSYRIPGFTLSRLSGYAFGFFAGFGLTHFWLDSRIWRVRHDPELRRALNL